MKKMILILIAATVSFQTLSVSAQTKSPAECSHTKELKKGIFASTNPTVERAAANPSQPVTGKVANGRR